MSDSANDPTFVACATDETTVTPDMGLHDKEEQLLLQQEEQQPVQTPKEASFEEKESHDTNELPLSNSEETDESEGDDNSLVAASEDMSHASSPTSEAPAGETEEAPAVETEKAPAEAAAPKKEADCGNENDDESYEYVDSDIDSNDSHNQSNSSSFLDLTPQREYWKWDPVWEHIKHALEQKKFCDPVALSQNEAFVRHWQEQHPPQEQQQGSNENAPRARAVTVESVESHPKVATLEEDHLEDWWKVAVSRVQQLLQDGHHPGNKDSMAKMSEADVSLLELLDGDDEELEEGIIVEEYIETTSSTSAMWQLLEHVLVAMMILLAGLYLGKKLGLEFEITPSQEAAPARFLFP